MGLGSPKCRPLCRAAHPSWGPQRCHIPALSTHSLRADPSSQGAPRPPQPITPSTLAMLPGQATTLPPPGLQAWTPAQGPEPAVLGTSEAEAWGHPAVREGGRPAGVGPWRLPAAGAGAGSCAAGALPPSLPPGSPPPRRGFAPFSRPLRFLSSSGSYSFPARKQPCLLKKPPWPQRGPGLGTRALSA